MTANPRRGNRGTTVSNDSSEWWKQHSIQRRIARQEERTVPCFTCDRQIAPDSGIYLFMRPVVKGKQIDVKAGRICDDCRDGILEARGLK